MHITVLIPTYQRPADLARCLNAIGQQQRLPDEVVVVARNTDTSTLAMLMNLDTPPYLLRTVEVAVPGQVAALNAGLDAISGDIIAITDDDAEPHPHWLQTLESHYQRDYAVGGVGGRDWIYINGQLRDAQVHPGANQIIGNVSWFGRSQGNHHIGAGEARSVDTLKGANMSFRRSAIADTRFDTRLWGTGAQVHNDLGFCLALKRKGWTLIYDPLASINHYPGQRFDSDQRRSFNQAALLDRVHNETLVMLEHLSFLGRIAYFVWFSLIGTRNNFGLVQWLRFLPQDKDISTTKLLTAFDGRRQGWQTWRQSSRKRAINQKSINQHNQVKEKTCPYKFANNHNDQSATNQ